MAFKFSIVSDVREVLRGNDAMEKGFDETAGSLDDLAREAKRSGQNIENSLDNIGDAAKSAGDKIEKEMKGGAREAGDESDKLERKFRDAFREVEQSAKSAGDEVGDRLKKGSREAEDSIDRVADTTGEFKDEARQNFGEITSSFSGDMDSIVDLAQGTFGGLAGTLSGPVGLAFGGLAASAGLFYNAWKDNAEKTEQRISDMYEDMRESGSEFLSNEYLSKAIDDIIQGADGAATSLDNIKDSAERVGVSQELMLRAWAGDQEAINQVLEATKGKQDDIRDKFDGGALDAPSRRTVAQLQDIVNGLEGVENSTDNARGKVELYDSAIAGLPTDKTTDLNANTDPARARIDELLGQMDSARPSVQVQADTDEAERQINNWASRRRVVTISPRMGQEAV